jgi:hypothetical protein
MTWGLRGLKAPITTIHLPLKKISGGNTSMTASEFPRVLTVVLFRVCAGNFFCTGCSRDWLLKRFI